MFKKEIVIFYPSFENGGATKNLINIINYLLKKNFKINLLSHSAKKKYFLKSKNLKVIALKKKFPKHSSRFFINIFFFFLLISFLKKKGRGISLILSMQSHLISILVAKFFFKKIIIRLSEDPIGATIYSKNKLNSFLVLISKIIFYNLSDGFIAISKKSRISLLKFVSKKKIRLIYNPYLKKLSPYKNIVRNKNIALFIGRFVHQKNVITLLDIIYEINFIEKIDLKLILIGDGPLLKQVEKKIIDLKLQNICTIIPWRSDLKKFYNKAKFLILPSLYEGLPNVLIDAANNNLPIIATDVSGVTDILLNGKAGFISKISKKFLKEKILFLLNNYKTANKKSILAKKNVYRFLIGRNCKKYLNFINKFIYQ